MEEKPEVKAAEDRLGAALDRMEQALGRMEAQYEALNAKMDRIVAAVEQLPAELKAEHRKTLSPTVTALLAKNGVEAAALEGAVLEKALHGLSTEQRIAVKTELARAGMIE